MIDWMIGGADETRTMLPWAGSKRNVMPVLIKYICQREFNAYHELFVGAGNVFDSLNLTGKRVFLNDKCEGMMAMHNAIRDRPAQFIRSLAYYERRIRGGAVNAGSGDVRTEQQPSADGYELELAMFLKMRALYNSTKAKNPSIFVVLCTLCFCSIYRENQKGQMTSPFRARSSGRRHISSPERIRRIRAMHAYMAANDVTLTCEDFETASKRAERGDLVYLDPPYRKDIVSYAGFNASDSDRVERVFRELVAKGCSVVLSEHDTPYNWCRYKDFDIVRIPVLRSARQRDKKQFELLIMRF